MKKKDNLWCNINVNIRNCKYLKDTHNNISIKKKLHGEGNRIFQLKIESMGKYLEKRKTYM